MQTRRVTIAFAFLLVVCVVNVAGKAGTCPDPSLRGPGICTSTCSNDETCAGYLKCCPNTCGAFTCALPENVVFEEYPPEKEGRCPPIPTRKGICTSTCANDQNCNGLLKCCSNNCGASTCTFPLFS